MYEIVFQCINRGNYELNDIITKISTLWVDAAITEEQYIELMELARAKAKPENSYAPEIVQLKERVLKLEKQIDGLLNSLPEDPSVPDVPAEEYLDYVQPTGAHDAYINGDKVIYNGKKYICIAPDGTACVYNPDAYPAFWELVE